MGQIAIRLTENVLILGASGELGSALARLHAARGARLCLWGRDMDRLTASADACTALGAAGVTIRSVDLMQLDTAITALSQDDDAYAFDAAYFAAGLGDIRQPGELTEDPHRVARLVQVNFQATAALCAELTGRMARRRRGKVAIVGSAAAFHALPFATAYAGSKAGLARFADALRIAMRPHGVSVTLVSPGFIDTAAARKVPGPKPFMLTSEEAARRITQATDKGAGHTIMPWPFRLLRMIDRILPQSLRDRLLRISAPPGL